MKLFKKLFVTILIIAMGACIGFAINPSQKVKAEEPTHLSTDLFVPSTYFEYYKLNNPIDVCQDENFIYIAENNAIVFYEKQTSLYSRLILTDLDPSITGITKIDCYKGNVFFINASKIYYLTTPDTNGDRSLVTTDIVVATYFAIYDNYLYANTSSSITVSEIKEEGALTFALRNTYNSDQLQNTSTISLAYSSTTNFLYYFTLNGCTKRISTTQEAPAFTQTTYYAKALNGKIYFTSENKFYEYDESTNILKPLFDLNTLCNSSNEIKGFNIYNDKILIVHSLKNEVYEYTLGGGYTGISIATTKNATNRLTENVVDIIYSQDYIYTLQTESILRFSTKEKKYEQFIFEDGFNLVTFNAKYFSISNNQLLLSNGNELLAFSFEESVNGLICTSLSINFPSDWDYNSITGLYAFDGEVYLLKNKTIDNVQNALVIKLIYNQTHNSFSIKSNDYVYQVIGNGQGFTINAFGELYLSLKESETSKKVICYDIINKKTTPTEVTFSFGVSKIFCDFENVYCLENNTIYNLTTNKTYIIDKHKNLDDSNPISITADITEGTIYVLYKGYILTTKDITLTSPNSFKIPQELYSKFYDNIKTYKLTQGAKLFEVEAEEEYFNFKNISSSQDKEYIYVSSLSESTNFCIINLEYKSYIARVSDLIVVPNDNPELSNLAPTFTPTFTKGYYVTRAGSYGLPILNYEQYSSNNLGVFRIKTIGAFTEVKILNGIIINNESFYLVKFKDDTKGYIQKDFIVEKINYFLADISSTTVYDILGNEIGSITPKKVKVYGKDNNMFVIDYNGTYGYVNIDSINQNSTNRENFFLVDITDTLFTPIGSQDSTTIPAQQVKVFGQENGKYIIEFQGQYGYIEESAVIKQKNNAIRNSLVVILVASSFFITGLYLQIKYNRKKEM